MLSGEEAPESENRQDQVGPTGGGEGKMAPAGVGQSMTRSGEDVPDDEGLDAGRTDVGTDGTTGDRPVGVSDACFSTGDPQDPGTDSPKLPRA